MTDVTKNLELIRHQIRALERQYSRAERSVQLLAVSKKQSMEKIRAAVAAGQRDFGENYVQEALEKIAALSDLECQWHFIGPIQSNKTKAIAEHFDWVESVDREKIARRLSEQRPASLPPLNVCVQVNLSAEASKSGTTLKDSIALCQTVADLPGLRLRGLMAIPAPLSGLEEQRNSFRPLAEAYRELQSRLPGIDTLSMGMSGDFAAAIAEGSTIVRLGTALFGSRD